MILFDLTIAQDLNFTLIRNPANGGHEYLAELKKTVDRINTIDSVDFNFCIGNLTSKGKADEFRNSYEVLSSLNRHPNLLPGQDDFWYDETGGIIIDELWQERNFVVNKANLSIIGLTSTVIWQRTGGHFSPETIDWLKDEIENIDTSNNIIILTYHNFSNIDNWFEVANLLAGMKIKFMISGEGLVYQYMNGKEIKYAEIQNFFNAQDSTFGFSLINLNDGTLSIKRISNTNDETSNVSIYTETNAFERTDSSHIYNYSTNILWEKELSSTVQTEPLVLSDRIIVADYSGYVQCFNYDGKLIWDFDAFGNIVSTPAEKDGWLAVATLQGDLHTLNVFTGEQIQSIGFDEAITSDLLMMDYEGTKELMIPKQSESKAAVVFSTAGGKSYCYDVETLQEYWSNDSPKGKVQIKPVLINNKIIFGSMDGYLYCLDAREGWLIWKWRESKNIANAPVDVTPVTDNKYIYIVTPMNHTVRIDMMLGKTIWKTDKYDVISSIGISNNKKRLLLKGANGNFYDPYLKNGRGGLTYKIKYKYDDLALNTLEYKGMYLFPTKEGNIYRIYKRRYKKLLFTGTAPMHNIIELGDGNFLASNIDGHIIKFSYSEK